MARPDARRLEENLVLLERRRPSLAAALRVAAPRADITVHTARTGHPVPCVAAPGVGSPIPLHSLYDPIREARRRADGSRGAGCIVALGIGAGYHLDALLGHDELYALVIVEEDVGTLRTLLETADLRALLDDPRVSLAIGRDAIRPAILAAWKPALMGDLATYPLRPWCEARQAFFADAAAEIQAAIETARGDYAVQAHFGKRWLANILLNLPRAGLSIETLPRATEVSVTAAGPSLAPRLDALAGGAGGGLIVATDTSLPALLRAGARPDVVVSIDCQALGYHHFLQGFPAGALLAADLASPPPVVRRAPRVLFLASAHPLVTYVSRAWRGLCPADMSGGNVTHAAVSLAAALGARRVRLYGADFSYPRGASYCRGTYLHDLFAADQTRVSSVETCFFGFLHRVPDTPVTRVGGHLRHEPAVLGVYRDRLEELLGGMDVVVDVVEGEGLSVRAPARPTAARPTAARASGSWTPPRPWVAKPWAPPPARDDWRAFLRTYAADLAALDVGGLSGLRFATRTDEERELWATILPVAARVRRDAPGLTGGVEAVRVARDFTVTRVARAASGSLQK